MILAKTRSNLRDRVGCIFLKSPRHNSSRTGQRMELHDAIQLMRPAVSAPGGTWADYGAGNGTFSRALAAIIGPEGRVLAVDHDTAALRALRRLEAEASHTRAVIHAVAGDVRNLDGIAELAGVTLDGAVLGNLLHFLPDAEIVLARVAGRVRPGGRVIVIEYDGASPTRWVPYPLSIGRFFAIAESAGLMDAEVVGERRSAYQGKLYCAAAVRRDRDDRSPRSRDETGTVAP
jgi:SAM-dependent methyltransferase